MTSMVELIISLNLLFSIHFLKRRLKFLRESTGNVLEKSNIQKQVTKNNIFLMMEESFFRVHEIKSNVALT